MKQKLLFLAVLCSIGMTVKAQTVNTSPLPAGETIIGNHLHAGASNEVWTDANALYFNYRGNASKTYFWNLGGSTGNAVMTLQDNGNVGIGTNNPQTKLEINGATRIKNGELQIVGDNLDIGGTLNLINTAKTGNGQASNWRIFNMGGGYGNSLQFWAYDNLGCVSGGMCAPRLTLMDNGNIGIGTTIPQAKLQIGTGASTDTYNVLVDAYRSDKGIAQYSGNWCSPVRWGIGPLNNLSNSTIRIGIVADAYGSWSETQNLNLVIGGNMGIGTTAPDQKLTVKGKIHAEEVIVDLAVPADYVFSKNYSLMPLHKVEQYVKTNSHLPDIPSAAEIKEQGLSMGEMQNKLLKKIEELTLYVIEQNKKIEQQEKRIKELKTK